MYKVIQSSPDELIEKLRVYKNELDEYLSVRKISPLTLTEVSRAARFIYLNKTAFNGLYRVNKKGEFNVPYGKYKNPNICNEEMIKAISASLAGIEILLADYKDVIIKAEEGDFIYMDPPYAAKNKTSKFTEYTSDGFSVDDHVELYNHALKASERGVNVGISNISTEFTRSLYVKGEVYELEGRHSISGNIEGRAKTNELYLRFH